MLLVDGIKKTVGISKISFLGCFYLYGSSQFQWLQESLLEFSSLPHFGRVSTWSGELVTH
ncbi:hypothetical protein CK203_033275 [Vitis vinifera]|uniref:Uncharacterized protein n=1 Tax=Vitis vinifera TaxID=29760 RepID=A0A438HC03_VITVI|nr:hypothetical protein CK203_033275 [Vitis vinifera]